MRGAHLSVPTRPRNEWDKDGIRVAGNKLAEWEGERGKHGPRDEWNEDTTSPPKVDSCRGTVPVYNDAVARARAPDQRGRIRWERGEREDERGDEKTKLDRGAPRERERTRQARG